MWTIELKHEGITATKEYRTASEACGAVHHYLELYKEQGRDVLITMKDPGGRWMIVKKTLEGLQIENQPDI